MSGVLGSQLSSIDFSKTELTAFEKDFYIEHPDVTKRPEHDADAWRASKQIVVVGNGVPKPCMTFEEASMPEYILTEVLKQGFERPTPIQSQGWPMALKGRNMVGISATGSGKTLAFLLPAMIHINAQVSAVQAVSSRRKQGWRTEDVPLADDLLNNYNEKIQDTSCLDNGDAGISHLGPFVSEEQMHFIFSKCGRTV
mmetsp:Transcript_3000/g.4386  ORF Transcript_3000/g.4386 Transcript_3000/m.4386 type:complete len:198 (-) Transcript_3000:2522-3115(-)